MKNYKSSFEFLPVIKHLIMLFSFLLFNNLESQVYPYSTALLIAYLTNGSSLLGTPILYLCAFLLQGQTFLLPSACIPAILFPLIVLIYQKAKAKLRIELLLFTAISLVGYVLIDYEQSQPIEKRVLVSVFTLILTFLCC